MRSHKPETSSSTHRWIFIALLSASLFGFGAQNASAQCAYNFQQTCSGQASCEAFMASRSGFPCSITYSPSQDKCYFVYEACGGLNTRLVASNITSEDGCLDVVASLPFCTGGGGCGERPLEHVNKSALSAEPGPQAPIVTIPGLGAFAEARLALTYDDGFESGSTHRLAFATMARAEDEHAVPVYSTAKLPELFRDAYGAVSVTRVADGASSSAPIASLLAREGAQAVVELADGSLIGLVDELHKEPWYIDAEEYSKYYEHDKGQLLFSARPGDPVTLNLATVYVWDGAEWTTDPLLVLDALSETFKPEPQDLARLRAAMRAGGPR